MHDYKLYFLDRTGHIAHAVDFRCDSDADALALAEQHRDGRDLELWQQARLVRQLPARAEQV
jgi:hypothetical protein